MELVQLGDSHYEKVHYLHSFASHSPLAWLMLCLSVSKACELAPQTASLFFDRAVNAQVALSALQQGVRVPLFLAFMQA